MSDIPPPAPPPALPPVAWPGTAPQPFDFPYAEAAAARAGLEELSDELGNVYRAHSGAFGGVGAANQGETMDRFRTNHHALMEDSGFRQLAVMTAIDSVDAMVARARAAEVERAAAQTAYAGRRQAYDQAIAYGQPPPPGSGPSHLRS